MYQSDSYKNLVLIQANSDMNSWLKQKLSFWLEKHMRKKCFNNLKLSLLTYDTHDICWFLDPALKMTLNFSTTRNSNLCAQQIQSVQSKFLIYSEANNWFWTPYIIRNWNRSTKYDMYIMPILYLNINELI